LKIGKSEYKKKTTVAKGPVTVVKIKVTMLMPAKNRVIRLFLINNEPKEKITIVSEAISHRYL
jgi:hypothetical protein